VRIVEENHRKSPGTPKSGTMETNCTMTNKSIVCVYLQLNKKG
jgi:hypothetical protein